MTSTTPFAGSTPLQSTPLSSGFSHLSGLTPAAAKVAHLQLRSYSFLRDVLERYKVVHEALRDIEAAVTGARAVLDRHVNAAEFSKNELEASLEVTSFLTALIDYLPMYQVQQNNRSNITPSIRFPRTSPPTDRFVQLASRLIVQRRNTAAAAQAAATNKGFINTGSNQGSVRRQSFNALPPGGAFPATAAAGVSPCPATFGIGFTGSLLGLSVNAPPAGMAPVNSLTNIAAGGPAPTLAHNPNSFSRTQSANQEPHSNLPPSLPSSYSTVGSVNFQQQGQRPQFEPTSPSSHLVSSASYAGGLTHGYPSQQNIKGLTKRSSSQQQPPQTITGGLGKALESKGQPMLGRVIKEQPSLQQSNTMLEPLSNTPVGRAGLVPPPPLKHLANANAGAAPNNNAAAAAIPAASLPVLTPSELLSALLALPGEDLLLLYRRYSEDVHAVVWAGLLRSRNERDESLKSIQALLEQREEHGKESVDLLDLAYHFQQMLESARATLPLPLAAPPNSSASSSSAAAAATSPPNARTASSSLSDTSPGPLLALCARLLSPPPSGDGGFSPPPQRRAWSDLISARNQNRPQVNAGVALLQELIECHRRLLNTTQVSQAPLAVVATTQPSPPLEKSERHTPSLPLPIARVSS